MIRICPSILNADFENLPREIEKIATVSDMLHLDVMDNVFVPNFTFNFDRAAEIIELSTLPVDVHLMISRADEMARPYIDTSAASITVHLEACEDPTAILQEIQGSGKRSGLAIKPGTPFQAAEPYLAYVDMLLVMTVEPGFGGQKFMADMMPKVQTARKWLDSHGFDQTWIEVDGGVSLDTIKKAYDAGADTFVAGSAVFSSPNPAEMVNSLRALISLQ